MSYIVYLAANMIQTSPRTKILLDLYHYKKISVDEYNNIYESKLMRTSTLPYDLIGLLSYMFKEKMSLI